MNTRLFRASLGFVTPAILAFVFLTPAPELLNLSVDGVQRRAWLCRPSVATPNPPVVFAWHGHGGNGLYAMRKYAVHTAWPEAVVVYATGLPTPGRTDPGGKKNGWVMLPGTENRDLKFFDSLYQKVHAMTGFDRSRCFAMGHSNGGGFTTTLWASRPDVFRGLSPHSGGGARWVTSPKPAFIVFSAKDPLVSPDSQRAVIEAAKRQNGATGAETRLGPNLIRYEGAFPTLVWTHDDKHEFKPETIGPMVEFFRSA